MLDDILDIVLGTAVSNRVTGWKPTWGARGSADPDDDARETKRHQEARPEVPDGTVEMLRPLLQLCLHVAHADGGVSADERRSMAQQLAQGRHMTGPETRRLKDLLAEDPPPVDELVPEVRAALPSLAPAQVVDMLARVANSDLHKHAAERAAVRHVATLLDVPESDWTPPTVALFKD